MSKKMVSLMAAWVFFMMGVLPAMHADATAGSGCREDCCQCCCGNEGICAGSDEQDCVYDCLLHCDIVNKTNSTIPVPTAIMSRECGRQVDGSDGDVLLPPQKSHSHGEESIEGQKMNEGDRQ
jgi:hypothetical protein